MNSDCHRQYRLIASCMPHLLLGLALGFSAAPFQRACAESSGEVLVDSGFRPNPHGFSFENWGGDEYPNSNLNVDDAVNLFGDRVCARWHGDHCVPTPATRLWLEQANEMMQGGHCEGMAAMSSALFVKEEDIADYGGAEQVYALKPKDTELMRTISEYFVTQALEPVQQRTSEIRRWPLKRKIDFLVEKLKSKEDYPTLGLYSSEGGHTVTPYKVEETREGSVRIYVYDNNYPGAEKYVEVDTLKNRWRYAAGAVNPKQDAAPWQGGAQAMDITPLSLRMDEFACPFCGGHAPPSAPRPEHAPSQPRKPSVISASITVATPSRCSQVVVTRKKDKKQLTFGEESGKDEIDGAVIMPTRGGTGCTVQLPSSDEYDVSLVDDGKPVTKPTTSVSLFSAGTAYSVSNVQISANTTQTLSVGSKIVTYVAGGDQKPTVRVAGDKTGSNNLVEITGVVLHDGKAFSAGEDKLGRLALHDTDPEEDSYDIDVEEVDESESKHVDFDKVHVARSGSALLSFGVSGTVELKSDSDSDGIDDSEDSEDNSDSADSEDSTDHAEIHGSVAAPAETVRGTSASVGREDETDE